MPKFYLERFAVDGNVELISRDNFEKVFPCSVTKALTETYFYSVHTEEGREPLGETWLAEKVEAPGAEAIRRVFDEGRSLAAPGPRESISAFLAFQYVRGPRVRQALVEQMKAVGRQLASMMTPSEVMRVARERGEEITEEEAADTSEFARSGAYTIEIPHEANHHIRTLFKAAVELVQFLHARTWRVLEFKEPALITSGQQKVVSKPQPPDTE